MQSNPDLPTGVIGFIIVDGQVACQASDFDLSAPGGFSKLNGQRRRMKGDLRQQFIKNYGGPIMLRVMSYEDGDDIVRNIISGRYDGISYVEEVVNYVG